MNRDFDKDTQKADLAFVKELMKIPILERDEEVTLTKAWRDHQDENALHQLVQAYARLVVSIAVKFRHYGIPVSELIQEGNLALMQAAERFDPNREVRFSSYAKWWIRAYIQDFILRNWSIVRTGSTVAQKQLFFNLRRLKAQLEKINTDHLEDEDREKIAKTLNVTLADVQSMENRLAAHDLSLSAQTTETSEESWEDLIPDERETPEMATSHNEKSHALNQWIIKAMEHLSPRERQIISARRLSEPPMTLEDVGNKLQISKERVRQLEVRAIRKMRHHLMHSIHNVRDILND